LKHEVHLNNIKKVSSYLTEKTVHHHYKEHFENMVYGNNPCLFLELYKTHKYIAWTKCRISEWWSSWYIQQPLCCRLLKIL
jgi:hypothetical protein